MRIALFNHKGGVSKTTTTFHLGWMLASLGNTVLLVDTDPQCNLTGLVLGQEGGTELAEFYETNPTRNIRAGLAPVFEARPVPLKPVDCVTMDDQNRLFLLPGHIGLAEYEVTLGIAQELSGSIQTLQNVPGAIVQLLRETAEHYKADYTLIDMSPSLGSINQNILMTSDFFVVPASPDFFSLMAIDSLSRTLPRWHAWAVKAASLSVLQDATYPFPHPNLRFLGTIIQKYRPRGGEPAKGFQTWIDRINEAVSSKLTPALRDNQMLLPNGAYRGVGLEKELCLATIADFNTLIAKSQETQTPIFALTPAQLKQGGVVLENTLKSRDAFAEVFRQLAEKIVKLTS